MLSQDDARQAYEDAIESLSAEDAKAWQALNAEFMTPALHYGEVYRIETKYDGTLTVPAEDYSAEDLPTLENPDEPQAPVAQFYGRLSANGYMDCTDYYAADTAAEVVRELLSLYADYDDAGETADEHDDDEHDEGDDEGEDS